MLRKETIPKSFQAHRENGPSTPICPLRKLPIPMVLLPGKSYPMPQDRGGGRGQLSSMTWQINRAYFFFLNLEQSLFLAITELKIKAKLSV